MEKEIEISRVERCDRCGGDGAEPGSKVKDCPECKGSGQVRNVQNTPFGRFETVKTCNRCRERASDENPVAPVKAVER